MTKKNKYQLKIIDPYNAFNNTLKLIDYKKYQLDNPLQYFIDLYGMQYRIDYVPFEMELTATEYRKIKKYDISWWTPEHFKRYLKIQKPSSKYQMIPYFGYPRELCISAFRVKIQTDRIWMKRALQILSGNFTGKEKQKYRSIEKNGIGANRVDSPRILYCLSKFDDLTENDIKYLKEVLAKYAAQILKYADKSKMQKFFDSYFNSPVPFQ